MKHESSEFIGHYEAGPNNEFRAELPSHDPDWITTLVFLTGTFLFIGLSLLFMAYTYGDTGFVGGKSPTTSGDPVGSQKSAGIIILVVGVPLSIAFGWKKEYTDLLEISERSLRVRAGKGMEHNWPLEDIVVKLHDSRLELSFSDDPETVALNYPKQELKYLYDTVKGYQSGIFQCSPGQGRLDKEQA